jgi:hypothetical protein
MRRAYRISDLNNLKIHTFKKNQLMKSLVTLLLIVGMTAFAQAQITLTHADVPGAGDAIVLATDTTVADLNIGTAGSNQSWNFLALENHEVYATNYLLPAQAPLSAEFPEANLCAESQGAYTFMEVSESELLGLGLVADLTGDNNYLSVHIDPPQKLTVFPTTFGTTFQTTYATEFSISGEFLGVDSLRIKQTAAQTTFTDAYGVVLMPNGLYDALRQYVVTSSLDSIWALFAGQWLLVDAQINESESYQWLSVESKGVLVTIEIDPNTDLPFTATHFVSYTQAVQAPVAAFTFEPAGNGEIVFTDASSNTPTEWLWDFGDNTTSTEQNPTHVYSESDMYEVCLTATNDGGSSTICQIVAVIVVATGEPGQSALAKVYPNPVQDVLRFQFNRPLAGGEQALLFDAFGQLILRSSLQSSTDLNMSALPTGPYFYQLINGEGRVMQAGKVLK